MNKEEIQVKMFELGELLGNSIVSQESGNPIAMLQLKAESEIILAQFRALGAHIEIWTERQFQRPEGRRWICPYESLLFECHGGKIMIWILIEIVIDGTGGHVIARVGDINTGLDLTYEDDCGDEAGGDDSGGDNPGPTEIDSGFLRSLQIKPLGEN